MGQYAFNLDGSVNYSINALIERGQTGRIGILGVECASAWWNLCSFSPDIAIFMIDDKTAPSDGIFYGSTFCMYFVPNVNFTNTVELAPNVIVTDKEQTVVDMVRYQRQEFHLYETVMSAYEGEVDIERMESIAESYGVLDRLREINELAIEAYEEDNA